MAALRDKEASVRGRDRSLSPNSSRGRGESKSSGSRRILPSRDASPAALPSQIRIPDWEELLDSPWSQHAFDISSETNEINCGRLDYAELQAHR